MSKALTATCVGNIVTCEGRTVSGVTILGEGVASSSGVLILTGTTKYYVPKISTDLKDVLTTLTTLLTNVVTVLTAHDGALGGTQAATIASITTAIGTLTTKKEALK